MSRLRSPNYPSLSLPVALEKLRLVHKVEGRNAIPREALVKVLGFGGLNGASGSAVSAIAKYGLLEFVRDGEFKVSDLAMRILFPENDKERSEAVREAAVRPALFQEIKEKWPDRPPGDDSLRTHLSRNGFAPGALEQVIKIYRDTIDMIEPEREATVGAPRIQEEPTPMQTSSTSPATAQTLQVAPLLTTNLTTNSSRPFSVAFDGSVLTGTISIRSVRDIDRLMKVLAAQKAAFEAMQEDAEGADVAGTAAITNSQE